MFVGRALAVQSSAEAQSKLAELIATNKKISKASHNITAWRIADDKTGVVTDQGNYFSSIVHVQPVSANRAENTTMMESLLVVSAYFLYFR